MDDLGIGWDVHQGDDAAPPGAVPSRRRERARSSGHGRPVDIRAAGSAPRPCRRARRRRRKVAGDADEPPVKGRWVRLTRVRMQAPCTGMLTPSLAEGPVTDLSEDVPEEPEAPLTATAAVPEESAPGESASNGAAERAIQMVEDQLRTMKHALEARLGVKIPCSHQIMRWMLEHAAMLLTNYHCSSDDHLTGYQRLHGHACTNRLPEFGETVMWYVPRRIRHKLDFK